MFSEKWRQVVLGVESWRKAPEMCGKGRTGMAKYSSQCMIVKGTDKKNKGNFWNQNKKYLALSRGK